MGRTVDAGTPAIGAQSAPNTIVAAEMVGRLAGESEWEWHAGQLEGVAIAGEIGVILYLPKEAVQAFARAAFAAVRSAATITEASQGNGTTP